MMSDSKPSTVKMQNKSKSAENNSYNWFKAFVLDYVTWLYILGSLYYLGMKWFELDNSVVMKLCSSWMPIYMNQWFITHIFTLSIFIFPILLSLLMMFSRDSLGVKLFVPESALPGRWYCRFWGWKTVFLMILTIAVGYVIVEIQPVKFFTHFRNAKGIVSGLLHPNLDILTDMLFALAESVMLALMATIVAIPFAFFLSFFAAQNLMKKHWFGRIIYFTVRTISTVFRSIEAIVWAIIFSVWVGIGPFAGMLALMIHSIASLVKLYSEQIENVDNGPIEAVKATGASTLQVWRYAVVPQILGPFLAFTIYRWDINVRMATIVGFVGGGGIGLALQQQQQMLAWRNVGVIMWLIAIVVWVMDIVSAKIREKLMDA
jgi:phosphonate transport system permease protein